MQQRWLFFATALNGMILTTFKQSLYQVVGWTMAIYHV